MLIVVFALALPFAMQDTPERHVRATERSILALINAGIDRSATFRDLIATLNASDVVVYIEPKVKRPRLRGYLAHQIVARRDHRYLRIAIDTGASSRDRLIRLIAHELQHAVEVAQMPEARDAASLQLADHPPAPPPAAHSPHIHLTDEARTVMETLMTGARPRLTRAECRELFTDFVDRDGHTLATILARSGRTPGQYLGDLYFVDASTSAQCRSDQVRIAFTAPKSRVVYLCSRRLGAYFAKKTSAGEILLIHELLHTLGLGENPPTSVQITDRVWKRCGSPERND